MGLTPLLLASLPSLSHCSHSLHMLPGIALQMNYIPPRPCPEIYEKTQNEMRGECSRRANTICRAQTTRGGFSTHCVKSSLGTRNYGDTEKAEPSLGVGGAQVRFLGDCDI